MMTFERFMRNYRSLRRVWLRQCKIARKHRRYPDLHVVQARMRDARRQLAEWHP